jgi:hypothetical protein
MNDARMAYLLFDSFNGLFSFSEALDMLFRRFFYEFCRERELRLCLNVSHGNENDEKFGFAGLSVFLVLKLAIPSGKQVIIVAA